MRSRTGNDLNTENVPILTQRRVTDRAPACEVVVRLDRDRAGNCKNSTFRCSNRSRSERITFQFRAERSTRQHAAVRASKYGSWQFELWPITQQANFPRYLQLGDG